MEKLDFIKEVLFDEEDVSRKIPEIRQQILDYYKDVKGVKVFTVLQGGEYFSELLFSSLPHKKFKMARLSASSYVNNKKLPNDKISIGIMGSSHIFSDDHILVIDDIYETGNTLSKINDIFTMQGATVQNVVLIKRSGHHKFEVPILSYGFEVTKKDYLVGCGLDYYGQYRKLPYIASVKDGLEKGTEYN